MRTGGEGGAVTEEAIEQLLLEEKLTVAEAARLVGGTHNSTVVRWCTPSVILPDGRRLNLEHLRCGGKIQTTRPALTRFLAAQTAAPADAPAPRSPAERKRAAAEAGRELDALLG
ncbi:MAG: hypothetical protein C0501_19785 [Isosphaera sp.]|nr:hypothetical protein [Isosphaera sp.]